VRRAAKVDDNQALIVKALRAIGAKCYYIMKPVDLIVGYRSRNFLMEIKNRNGKDALTKEQAEFLAGWPGEVHIVYTPEEAINVVTRR
jgi:hypothetical protein